MYVQWREREHDAANELVAADPNVMAVLTQCGLVKFFLCPFMHAQARLLNALVDYWHLDAEAFMIEGQSLVPTTKDIYFLMGLSRRGELVNFHTFPAGPSKVSELIEEYCEAGTDQRISLVPVSRNISLALQTILSLIGWITGSTAVHQASRAHMNCAIQCMNAQIFDWSTTLLASMLSLKFRLHMAIRTPYHQNSSEVIHGTELSSQHSRRVKKLNKVTKN
jgi:hypothetical protein